MARKSGSGFGLLLYAVGGYLVYSNWPAISAWAGSLVSAPTPAAPGAGATYPNSPVPAGFSTMQTFVDTAGNQWQFSTQTGQWVIAAPAAAAPPSAGTVVPAAPPAPLAPQAVANLPASPQRQLPPQFILVRPPIRPVFASSPAMAAPAQPAPTPAPGSAGTLVSTYGMPHYRGY